MIFNDTFPTRATHYQGHVAHKISRVKDISGPRFRKPRPAPGKNVRTKVSCFEHAVFARKPRFMKRSTNFDWPQATVRVTINGVATINSTREVPGDNHTSREHIFCLTKKHSFIYSEGLRLDGGIYSKIKIG